KNLAGQVQRLTVPKFGHNCSTCESSCSVRLKPRGKRKKLGNRSKQKSALLTRRIHLCLSLGTQPQTSRKSFKKSLTCRISTFGTRVNKLLRPVTKTFFLKLNRGESSIICKLTASSSK